MKKTLAFAMLSCSLAAAPALAEEPAADAATTAEATATAEAAPAAPAAAPITDAQLDMFAAAAVKVNDISGDAALTDEQKQAAMVEAVNASGLDAQTFNEIATKSQTDETMKTRVAEAFGRLPAPAAEASAEAETETQTGG